MSGTMDGRAERPGGHGRVAGRAGSGAFGPASGAFAGTRPAAGARRPHRRFRAAITMTVLAALAAGCASAPPKRQGDVCGIFDQHPSWQRHARKSAERWGTPVHVLMAFVRHESSFRARAKPPRRKFLGIPLRRPSSAKGYAQAQDPVWNEYEAERGRLLRSRSDMKDALDFIGWYNDKTWRELKISRSDARRLYPAYHEGRRGYRRGTWKSKPGVQRTADKVAETARRYESQLRRCG